MKPQVRLTVIRPNSAPNLDTVADEIAVAFEYNGISHTVMLATPTNLGDFALGFSLTEGIVERRSEVLDIEIEEVTEGIILHLEIFGGAFARLKGRRRSLAGRTGCGLCGAESLSQVMRNLLPVADGVPFPVAALYEGISRLPAQQVLQQTTGAVHAACRVATDGSISYVREDVGRHNALDKTLGALAGIDTVAEGALIITSRASFEMVQKSAAMGYGILAAVSAPTAAAIRLADKLNLTLIGFLRDSNCAIYTHANRIQGNAI